MPLATFIIDFQEISLNNSLSLTINDCITFTENNTQITAKITGFRNTNTYVKGIEYDKWNSNDNLWETSPYYNIVLPQDSSTTGTWTTIQRAECPDIVGGSKRQKLTKVFRKNRKSTKKVRRNRRYSRRK